MRRNIAFLLLLVLLTSMVPVFAVVPGDWTQPVITTASILPEATAYQPYTCQLEADSGIAPYKWSIGSGQLPEGLTIDEDGLISGTLMKSLHKPFEFKVILNDFSGEDVT